MKNIYGTVNVFKWVDNKNYTNQREIIRELAKIWPHTLYWTNLKKVLMTQ